MDELNQDKYPFTRKAKNLILGLVFTVLCSSTIEAQEFLLVVEVIDELTQQPLESAEIIIDQCSCGGITRAAF
jgi:hypothetical protein